MNLPSQFLGRMRDSLKGDYPAFLRSYDDPPRRAVRVNTLKLSAEEFERIAPFPLGERVPWEPRGFYIGQEKAGADVYHFAGLFYSQEPSAMCAAPMLGVRAGERVLDLCAAPGGKTGQLAADMGGSGVLVANEPDFGRAEILSRNLERLGVRNCTVTAARPEQLAARFPAYFDKILVDAPCSGEGMFKKEAEAVLHWSERNVALCAARQREILDEAAKMLAGGGRLVYSTCTFSEEEDERQAESFAARHGLKLIAMKKLLPHEAAGEGHFAALFEREDGERRAFEAGRAESGGSKEGVRAYRAFERETFGAESGEKIVVRGGRLFAVPDGTPLLFGLPLRGTGVELGTFDGRFKPSHALAMARGGEAARFLSLTRAEAEVYLRGETLAADLPDGWCVVGVDGFPLGWGKAVRGTVKNHLPKGARRMAQTG